MGNVCRWLASQAEDLGVEIFPGMACSELVYGNSGEIKGVVAGEFRVFREFKTVLMSGPYVGRTPSSAAASASATGVE